MIAGPGSAATPFGEAPTGTTLDRLRAILAAHHDLESTCARAERRTFAEPSSADLRSALAQALRRGVDQGEVRPDADLDAFVDTLLAVYVWTWRGAGCAETERLSQMMDRQVALLFDQVADAV